MHLLLPENGELLGWSAIDSARVYRGQDLFHFMDGGADLFFEYGFRQALAIEYQNAGGKRLNVELYEMNDPGASYGIYSLRSGEGGAPKDIGQGGSAHAYYGMFWKGRFYVSLSTSDSTRECRQGVDNIARAVDRKLSPEGQRPGIVDSLPKENLLWSGYFRGSLGLLSLRALELEEIFRMTDGAFGNYADHMLILLRYSSEEEARDRLTVVCNELKTNRHFRNLRLQDKLTTVADSRDRTLCIGSSGSKIIVSISPKESIARSSFNEAASLLRAR